MEIEIPKQLQNKEFKFIRLGSKSKNPLKGIKWKENMYAYDNPILLQHLKRGGNYGVVAGYGKLRILDVDNLELAERIFEKTSTFTVKSCGGGYHFYFLSDDKENRTSSNGEYRAMNQYCVGPNCYADDEKKNHHGFYVIIKNIEIKNE